MSRKQQAKQRAIDKGPFSRIVSQYSRRMICETEWQKFNHYTQVALSVWEWKGLPPACDAEYLEQGLYYQGRHAVVDIDALGIINLRVQNASYRDIHGHPTRFTLNGSNSVSVVAGGVRMPYNSTSANTVYIRNNALEVPTADVVEYYCGIMASVQRTINMNLYAHRNPLLLTVRDARDKQMVENVFQDYDSEKPVIVVGVDTYSMIPESKINSNGPITVVKTGVDYIIDRLYQYLLQQEHALLTALAIKNNSVYDKAERISVPEIQGDAAPAAYAGINPLIWRQRAAKEMNEKFGLNVTVSKRKVVDNEISGQEAKQPGTWQQVHANGAATGNE